MKTLQQVKDRIEEILNEYSTLRRNGKNLPQKTKMEYEFLQPLWLYLETNPRPEFLEKEKNRIWTRIELIEKSYSPLSDEYPDLAKKKHKSDYIKGMDVAKLKAELKVINYLLNEAA